jgi:4-hydroxybenzoate polyprenyltransferase
VTRFRDLIELVRAPAALTVPGDSLAGAAVAGWPFGARTPALAVSSCCLYWAGMALNDYADRELDRTERPERPIPSGRVAPGLALAVATGLTAAGLGLAGLAGGRRALAVAVPLAGMVWAYDLTLKSTLAGPPAMAACRSLDVLLGAGAGRLRQAAPAALAVGTHALAVTAVSRGEVTGGSPAVVGAALAGTATAAAGAGLAARGAARHRRPPPGWRPVQVAAAGALLAGYAATVGRAQLAAARTPQPGPVRRAVGAGILGNIPLQAALAAGAGALRAAVPIAAGFPLARRLARRVSPT